VQHPHNYQALFIRRGQFLVLIIPLDNHDVTLVALQVLIHRQIATTLAFA